MVKHGDLVKIDDCVQLMCHGDNGVFCEFLPHDALDHGVCNIVDARGRGRELAWVGEKGEGIERTEDRGLTYLLVASSSTSIELCLRSAWARQKSCF